MTSEAILIPKIYARLQEIASNFSKFSGGGPPDPPPALAPSALGSGLRPLTGPPLSKSPGSAPDTSRPKSNADLVELPQRLITCKAYAGYSIILNEHAVFFVKVVEENAKFRRRELCKISRMKQHFCSFKLFAA